jgi:hypothetical protein
VSAGKLQDTLLELYRYGKQHGFSGEGPGGAEGAAMAVEERRQPQQGGAAASIFEKPG